MQMTMLAVAAPTPLIELASVVVLGGAAQWLAWRIRLPSILLLLICGFIAGPVTGLLDPDLLFGKVLRPFVALSVALILFEGGLTLDFSELKGTGGIVRNLVTVGLIATGVVCAAAAYWIVGMSLDLSFLLGAILTVTGPTVIQPMLRYIRPQGPVAPILKWEGIVIDPIGALIAVLVFEGAFGARVTDATTHFAVGILKTVLIGGGLGALAAWLLAVTIRRYWVPGYLQNSVALLLVAAAFAASNYVQAESGLLAATVMGMVLGNQKSADVRGIVEFKENLRVLLISTLFILLSARIRFVDVQEAGLPALLFVAVIIFVGRPLCVLVSTVGSRLRIKERMFLAWMAPRGIVAASVASIFALDLELKGIAEARILVPMTFATIVSTVLLYGLTAAPLARRLGLAEKDPQGLLILGAHRFGRTIAAALKENGFKVQLVDNNPQNAAAAKMLGVPTYLGSILGERAIDDVDLMGVGRLLALTPNDPVNVLAVQRFHRIFGPAGVFQLTPKGATKGRSEMEKHLHGRLLFAPDMTYSALDERCARGDVIKTTKLTDEFDFAAFKKHHGSDALPLFLVTPDKKLHVVTADKPPEPKEGTQLVALIRASDSIQ